ncbi:MAG: hypothetical protein CL543_02685 [Alcanivorax sp.]|nr:hypothetical protein [Alcanivorax sp.]
MSIEIMKKGLLAAVAGCSLFAAASASAVTFDPATPNNPYTFAGETRLVTPLGTYVCDLELTGNVSDAPTSDPNAGTVMVTGGNVSGDFPCGLINLQNLPWGSTGNATVTSGGATVNLDNIGAQDSLGGMLLDCSGDITVPFINDTTASRFDLDGQGFGGCTFTRASGSPDQNLLFADPSNNIQVFP